MTPTAFIKKWHAVNLKERSAAQEHFIDVCHLLGEPTPAEADPEGTRYCFERGASKLTGGNGWADVWRRDHFGWEYKGKHKDLRAAYVQLQQYAVALENPPLLVVCDLEQFRIHTNWTNTVQQVYDLALEDLDKPAKLQILRDVFSDPERLKPGKTRQLLTEEAAEQFASLAQRLRARGYQPHTVAHFVNRLVFCMFAEDVGLLPSLLFTRMLEQAVGSPTEFRDMAHDLFQAMQGGGRVGFEHVEWFNGGLFESNEALPLDQAEIALVLKAARLDWSDIDPSIFGTLFERGLDPDKRSQLGAHYTDRDKIMRIIEPVLIQPLHTEWEVVKLQIAQEMEIFHTAAAVRTRNRSYNTAQALHNIFLDRLRHVRVLDPACGSGNFLYLALLALKDLEHRTNLDAEVLGLGRQFPSVGPECVKGIEINPYAAELARMTVWIGEIQWMRRNGFDVGRRPILRPLDTIECRDAVLNPDGSEPDWPEAEVIIGNPPFLGGSKILGGLGEEYTEKLRALYKGLVPGGADLVTYWFEKARAAIAEGKTRRAGFVATQAIRAGSNRKVLEHIKSSGDIYEAWNDEPWVVEGAAVRVSLICFTGKEAVVFLPQRLDGETVQVINSNLSSQKVDFTSTSRISQNRDVSFEGTKKYGDFEISGQLAREWLQLPTNPNGKKNMEVLKPWINGMDITQRRQDKWIIDFSGLDEESAALYEAPFQYVRKIVKPTRNQDKNEKTRINWWLFERNRPEMRAVINKHSRYITTPRVAKYRLFVWMTKAVIPDSRLYVIARDDYTTFGILHSQFHEVWSLATCSWHGDGNEGGRPTYNAHSCFETFPFPKGLTPDILAVEYIDDPRAQKIAVAAKQLDTLRNNWLNPLELVIRVPEVVAGYSDRLLPKDEAAATILKTRTLTNLYNARPMWLANAHRDLDIAVAAAYGWQEDLSDDEMLNRLFVLNQTRTQKIL